METYRFASAVLSSGDPAFATHLARAYSDKSRPLCMCMSTTGVPMYVSRLNDRFLVKRMPNTGSQHHTDATHTNRRPNCPASAR